MLLLASVLLSRSANPIALLPAEESTRRLARSGSGGEPSLDSRAYVCMYNVQSTVEPVPRHAGVETTCDTEGLHREVLKRFYCGTLARYPDLKLSDNFRNRDLHLERR